MAMIQIVKGSQHLEVTSGAFKTMFEPSGWSLQSDVTVGATAEQITGLPHLGVTNRVGDKNDTWSNSVDKNDDADESDENDLENNKLGDEELTEKPLAEMSFEELKRYAEIMNIDITGSKSKKEIRATIRAAM